VSIQLGDYMTASEVSAGLTGKKTSTWMIHDRHGGLLGHVAWYGAWRQYCFFPDGRPVFNRSCLNEITCFLIERMAEWRRGRKP
jgi:hypothetical protein